MIAIIDYKAGNLASVKRALDYLGFKNIITSDIKKIEKATKIIFPGVSAAGSAILSLKKLQIDELLKKAFLEDVPILGICLGTQIILRESEEDGGIECLSLIDGVAKKFPKFNQEMKIPHMGWNNIKIEINHPILKDIDEEKDEFYFVHSFYPEPQNKEDIIATTDYYKTFPSIIGKKSLIATQFHLEKSGEAGLKILKAFCKI